MAVIDATLVDALIQPGFAAQQAVSPASVVGLRYEVVQLGREVAELRQQVGYGNSMHARTVEENKKLEAEIDKLKGENRQPKNKLFGRQSEKKKSQDRSNHRERLEAGSAGPKRQRGH